MLGAASAAALALGLVPVSPAGAARATTDACPAAIPEDGFSDTGPDASALEGAVDCLVAYRITAGQGGTLYGTGRDVTRGQLATFVLNILDHVAGFARPTASPDAFADDDSSVHEDNINDAAALGIIAGFSDATFRPLAPVDRAQMATFIVNTLEEAGVVLPTASPDAFADDNGSQHEANIDILADDEVDIADGEADGSYNPGRTVVRGTMAFFLTRSLAVLVEADLVAPFSVGAAAATTRPELVAAAVTNTNTATDTGTDGTTVRFTFDEEVTGTPAPKVGSFFVVNARGERFTGSGTPTIETGGQSVLVQFSGIVSDGAAANLTLATVDFGAVADNEDQANPIGAAPLGTATGSTGFSAGQTDAPDLLTAGNVRAAGTDGATQVDFTFDDAAFTVNPAGFSVVLVNGTAVACAALAAAPGGLPAGGEPGRTTITVACEAPGAAAGSVTTSTVARGVVQTDTVSDDQADQADNSTPLATFATCGAGAGPASDCAGSTNPLQVSNTPDTRTTDPDLASATLARNPDQSGGSLDTVTFVFVEGVVLPVSPDPTDVDAKAAAAGFFVYDVTGEATAGVTAARGTNPLEVIVRFDDTVIDDAVGASAAAGAVQAQTGTADRVNDDDEVGVANDQVRTTGRIPGATAGPDLTGVNITSGASGSALVTFSFDEDIAGLPAGLPAGNPASPSGTSRLFLLQGDGTRLVCTAASAAAGAATCTAFAFTNDAGAATMVTANDAQVRNAVVGSVDDGAVTPQDGGPSNPEGAEASTGGTGTPAA